MRGVLAWDVGIGVVGRWHWEAMSSGIMTCSVVAVPCGVAVGGSEQPGSRLQASGLPAQMDATSIPGLFLCWVFFHLNTARQH